MSKDLKEGRLRFPLFTLLLNLYFFISIFMCRSTFRWDMKQGLYFVFGIFFLFIISFFFQPRRYLQNPWIGMLLVFSFVNVFIHSFIYSDLTCRFINFSLMCEGFIYVLCGSILFKLIYEHGEKDLRCYPGLWAALGVWFMQKLMMKSISPIMALVLASIIYCLYRRKYYRLYWISAITLIFCYFNWNYIILKWQARPEGLRYSINEIIKRPSGYGFDNTVMKNLIPTSQGWQYRHNDYLNLARDLGFPVLLVIVGLLFRIFQGVPKDFLFMLCLAFVILIGGQTTMYLTRNVFIVIPCFSLMAMRNE